MSLPQNSIPLPVAVAMQQQQQQQVDNRPRCPNGCGNPVHPNPCWPRCVPCQRVHRPGRCRPTRQDRQVANFRVHGHGHGRGGAGSGFLIHTQNTLIIGTGPADIGQRVTGFGAVIHNYGTIYITNPGANVRQVMALTGNTTGQRSSRRGRRGQRRGRGNNQIAPVNPPAAQATANLNPTLAAIGGPVVQNTGQNDNQAAGGQAGGADMVMRDQNQ